MLDFANFCAICDDVGVLVTAALYMWTNMCGTHLEREMLHVPVAALTNRVALFLERATNNNEEVFEVDVLREKHCFSMFLVVWREHFHGSRMD